MKLLPMFRAMKHGPWLPSPAMAKMNRGAWLRQGAVRVEINSLEQDCRSKEME